MRIVARLGIDRRGQAPGLGPRSISFQSRRMGLVGTGGGSWVLVNLKPSERSLFSRGGKPVPPRGESFSAAERPEANFLCALSKCATFTAAERPKRIIAHF